MSEESMLFPCLHSLDVLVHPILLLWSASFIFIGSSAACSSVALSVCSWHHCSPFVPVGFPTRDRFHIRHPLTEFASPLFECIYLNHVDSFLDNHAIGTHRIRKQLHFALPSLSITNLAVVHV